MSPGTTFDVLIPLAMASDYPIPVTDGDNRLVAEIHRSALAEALAETATADQDYEANVAANAALPLRRRWSSWHSWWKQRVCYGSRLEESDGLGDGKW